MRPCAALLLLVSASLPGCGLTRTVWQGAFAREVPGFVKEVVVLPDGDVFIRYPARCSQVYEAGTGFLQPEVGTISLDRAIQVPASDMARFLGRKGTGTIPEVGEKELRKFILPSPSHSPYGAPVKFRQQPDDALVFAYPRLGRDGQVGEPRRAEDVTVRFHLPVGLAGARRSLVVPVLLTPPAAIADAAFDAVVIVTAPVWFPIWYFWLSKIEFNPAGGLTH
jgi:hypothetical protein